MSATARRVEELLDAADQRVGWARSQLLAASRASDAHEVQQRKQQATEFEAEAVRLRARARRAAARVAS